MKSDIQDLIYQIQTIPKFNSTKVETVRVSVGAN